MLPTRWGSTASQIPALGLFGLGSNVFYRLAWIFLSLYDLIANWTAGWLLNAHFDMKVRIRRCCLPGRKTSKLVSRKNRTSRQNLCTRLLRPQCNEFKKLLYIKLDSKHWETLNWSFSESKGSDNFGRKVSSNMVDYTHVWLRQFLRKFENRTLWADIGLTFSCPSKSLHTYVISNSWLTIQSDRRSNACSHITFDKQVGEYKRSDNLWLACV